MQKCPDGLEADDHHVTHIAHDDGPEKQAQRAVLFEQQFLHDGREHIGGRKRDGGVTSPESEQVVADLHGGLEVDLFGRLLLDKGALERGDLVIQLVEFPVRLGPFGVLVLGREQLSLAESLVSLAAQRVELGTRPRAVRVHPARGLHVCQQHAKQRKHQNPDHVGAEGGSCVWMGEISIAVIDGKIHHCSQLCTHSQHQHTEAE